MKTYEIYHYIYEDINNDPYYGKGSTRKIIGYVIDTEENVRKLVDKLNDRNNSYYSEDDEEDEDYISYREITATITTIEEIDKRCSDRIIHMI